MEINSNELIKLNNMIIIDLREEKEFQKRHLQNAINLDFHKLIIEPEKYLLKNKKYLLVCDLGLMSKKTSEILNKQGYLTYSLNGGMKCLFKRLK